MFAQLIFLLLISYVFSTAWTWRRNIKTLEKSGLHVVICPIYIGNPLWMVLHKIGVPILKKLPQQWTRSWIDVLSPSWAYESTTKPFEREGDVIMVASPGGMYMTTNNAELISQITARRSDFIKPEKSYKIIEVFGPSVLSSEGSTWRTHRKITAPAFSEELHGLVWTETLRQVDQMLETWQDRPGNALDQMDIADLGHDTIALTLNIISRAGFGVSLSWPGHKNQNSQADELKALTSENIPEGHNMTFRDALEGTLVNFLWFVIFSPRVLGALPFQAPRKAWHSWVNFDRYLKELLEIKRSNVHLMNNRDLMSRLVHASSSVEAQPETPKTMNFSRSLQDRDITGNAFVFLVAGHETTSLSILYSCLFLAINQSAQSRLQTEIDAILKGKTIQECQYEEYYDQFSNSMVGAVINEQLRLLPPVILLPKVVATGDQTVTVDGRTIIVPNDTFVHLPSVPLHRNPRYWPHEPSKRTNKSHDLDDFRPERWFIRETNSSDKSSPRDLQNTSKAKTPTLTPRYIMYSPPQGAFIPFSEGQRGCLGRRFALVEMTVALTSIFSRYSIELATDEWAAEANVVKMTAQEREILYQKAVDKAWHTLETGASARLTLQLDKGKEIPVCFVKRGRKRFT